jgi:hypothetical protein
MRTYTGDKDRAKRIIAEIIKQNGGVFVNKTNLFKAFYRAHLYYAEREIGYLSDWPIVKMPRGPGIDNFDLLLGELLTDGVLHAEEIEVGSKTAIRFQWTGQDLPGESLSEGAIHAIRMGVEMVQGKTADSVSHESHRDSRSWHEAKNGERLNIYLDSLSDDEFHRRVTHSAKLAEVLKQN